MIVLSAQTLMQDNDREQLRELVNVANRGVMLTTILKFFPKEKVGKHPPLSSGTISSRIAEEVQLA